MAIAFSQTASPIQKVFEVSPTWTVTAPPFTVNVYAKPSAAAILHSMWGLADTGITSQYYHAQLRGDQANETRLTARAGGGTINLDTTAYTANQWLMVTCVVASATDRRIFVDGANKQTDATTANVNVCDEFNLGARLIGASTDFPFDGLIAEAAVWSRALTDGEILSLLNEPATVVPSNLYYYASYKDTFTSEVGPTLNVSGTPAPTIDPDHPPVSGGGAPFLKAGLTIGGNLKPSLLK